MQSQDRVVVLSRDLFFGMRIRTVLRQLGIATVLTKTEPEYVTALGAGEPAMLAIVDFNQPVDWDIVNSAPESPPVIAFGAHTDVAGFRAAKAAGVARTVSNGEFDRSFPSLLEKYRR
jgi:hypothetical protein